MSFKLMKASYKLRSISTNQTNLDIEFSTFLKNSQTKFLNSKFKLFLAFLLHSKKQIKNPTTFSGK